MRRRLDQALVEAGFFPSREKAQAAIMAGLVRLDDQPATKAGAAVKPDARLAVVGQVHPYVSRGGLKLEKALAIFPVSLEGRVVLDAGASTGGFTDVALRAGAAKVFAVDVGYGQLAWSLRQDPRVVVMERTNVRRLTPEALGEPVDAVVGDLSFISLEKVLPALAGVLRPGGEMLMLIKPQFEVGKEALGKNGVVREPALHASAVEGVAEAASRLGLGLVGLGFSPVTGPEGNREFLAHLQPGAARTVDASAIAAVVAEAHRSLAG